MMTPKRPWAVLALLLFALVGCAGPSLTLTHQPALDTARTKMFELTAGGARVASLELPVGTVVDTTPQEPPAAAPDDTVPAVGDAAPPTSGECEQLEAVVTKRMEGLEQRVAKLEAEMKGCKCNTPLAGIGSPGGTATASSPAVEWPPGCHVEVWVAPQCGPCKRWEDEEAPKLPATAYTVRDSSVEAELAAAKQIPSCPYYILTDTATKREILRIHGFATAEHLAKRGREELTPSVSSTTGDTAYVASLKQHMLTTHGRDCSSMGLEELEAAHNAAHGMAYGVTYTPGLPSTNTGTRLFQTVRYVGTSSRGNTRVRIGCKNCR